MLTSSISHQVSCRLTILAARTVGSPTVLFGGVILKATPFANACGEIFSSSQSHNPLCFAIGPLLGRHVSPRPDRQSHNLISLLTLFDI
jgi:hypothetical protein